MKHFHIHLTVENLSESILFYSQLFGQEPEVSHADYAKWMLKNPQVNFAISTRGDKPGLDHLGFQAGNPEELQQLEQRAKAAAGDAILDQDETTCCYAESKKHWTIDPSGIAWEHYHTMKQVKEYGVDNTVDQNSMDACCVPKKIPSNCCGPQSQAGSCC